jgi:hypothetical protein
MAIEGPLKELGIHDVFHLLDCDGTRARSTSRRGPSFTL